MGCYLVMAASKQLFHMTDGNRKSSVTAWLQALPAKPCVCQRRKILWQNLWEAVSAQTQKSYCWLLTWAWERQWQPSKDLFSVTVMTNWLAQLSHLSPHALHPSSVTSRGSPSFLLSKFFYLCRGINKLHLWFLSCPIPTHLALSFLGGTQIVVKYPFVFTLIPGN